MVDFVNNDFSKIVCATAVALGTVASTMGLAAVFGYAAHNGMELSTAKVGVSMGIGAAIGAAVPIYATAKLKLMDYILS